MYFQMKMCLLVIIIITSMNAVRAFDVYVDIRKELYCPANNTCDPPSTHVVCSDYDYNVKEATHCKKFKELLFDKPIAEKLLGWANGLRGQVALGKLQVKNNVLAPRGYGMIRLQWDGELAALARYQLRMCYDDRTYIINHCSPSGRYQNYTKTIIEDKNDDSAAKIAKSYMERYTKQLTRWTVEDIVKLNNDMTKNVLGSLKFLQGPATHVGCSMARQYLESKKAEESWTLCIVGYLTAEGELLYNITAPEKRSGLTATCGCPMNYRESEDCLCEEWRPATTSTFATYSTFETVRGLSLDEEQWNRGIPQKPVTQYEQEPLLIINSKEDGLIPFNKYHFYDLMSNIAMSIKATSQTMRPEVPTQPSTPSNIDEENIDIRKDSFIDDIMHKYVKRMKQAGTHDQKIDFPKDYLTTDDNMDKYILPSGPFSINEEKIDIRKDSFIDDIMHKYIRRMKQAGINDKRIDIPIESSTGIMDMYATLSKPNYSILNKKDVLIKTPEEILESIEAKSKHSLEKIVGDVHKHTNRRSEIFYDKENNYFEKNTENDRVSELPPTVDLDFEDTILL